MYMKIQVPCHWCKCENGYDVHAVIVGRFVAGFLASPKFYGICGRCFHTTPLMATPDDVKASILEGPIYKPTNPNTCLWCKSEDSREVSGFDRHITMIRAQGMKLNIPPRKLPDIVYEICKNCFHCTPYSPSNPELDIALAIGADFAPLETDYVAE